MPNGADRHLIESTAEFLADVGPLGPSFIVLKSDVNGEGPVAVNIDKIVAIRQTEYGCFVWTDKHQFPVRDDFNELVRALNGDES